mmetsp:Transcript_80485/g.203498  ORF Transcript_80485/g.203498 Transcript_80485/m.203498 type:complete len:354 (+) Transcript_80485:315-1376(+)
MHVALVDPAVSQALLYRAHGIPEIVHAQLLESSTGQRARIVNAFEERVDLDRRLCGRGQGALCALTLGPQTADGTLVSSQILASVLALEILHAEIHNAVVKVLTAKVRVTSSGLHLEDAILNGQKRDIEGASTHVVDEHVTLTAALLVQTVGDGRCRRLIDDTQHIHTRDGAGILSRLPLRVIEVGWHRDHGVIDLAAEVCLCGLLHLQQYHGAHFLRVKLFLLPLRVHHDHGFVTLPCDDLERPELDVRLHNGIRKLPADEALGIKDRILGVPRNLVLSGVSDQTFGVCESHIRGGGAVTLVVRDDLHAIVLPHTDAGVRCAQVDAHGRLLRHLELRAQPASVLPVSRECTN